METKTCRVCKEEKPLEAFHLNKQCKLGVVATCRLCTRNRIRKWYRDNRSRRQEAANSRNQQRKKELIGRFDNRCFDCHQSFPPCVYDFHHVDSSSKDFNPSAALTMSKGRREAELAKCVMLCANCHRIRHFGSDTADRKDG